MWLFYATISRTIRGYHILTWPIFTGHCLRQARGGWVYIQYASPMCVVRGPSYFTTNQTTKPSLVWLEASLISHHFALQPPKKDKVLYFISYSQPLSLLIFACVVQVMISTNWIPNIFAGSLLSADVMAINQVALREEPVVDTKDKKLKPIIHLVPNQHLVASYLAVKTIKFFYRCKGRVQ